MGNFACRWYKQTVKYTKTAFWNEVNEIVLIWQQTSMTKQLTDAVTFIKSYQKEFKTKDLGT